MFNKKDKGSLIICATPLQVLIAERIIDLHPEEEFYAILPFPHPSEYKLKYYGDRLIHRCGGGMYLESKLFNPNLGRIDALLELLRLWASFLLLIGKYKTIYISSFEKIPFRVLLKILSRADVYTFDDGLQNLDAVGYANNKKDFGGVLYNLFAFQPSQIKHKVRGHYTIYDAPNMSHSNPEKIQLFDFIENKPLNSDKIEVIRLCLGQPIFELDGTTEDNKQVTQKLISLTRCDKYLPHPRENYLVEGVEYINTPYIAEDYILQELDKYPNRCYELVSFFTTTLINLREHPRISVKAYKPHNLPQRWEEEYIVLERLGIQIFEI